MDIFVKAPRHVTFHKRQYKPSLFKTVTSNGGEARTTQTESEDCLVCERQSVEMPLQLVAEKKKETTKCVIKKTH